MRNKHKNNNIKQNVTFGLMFPVENKNEFQEDTKGQTANIDINSFFIVRGYAMISFSVLVQCF